ncbi:hypothetical protein FSP39_024720 [Pinctada imbricata]|uniref:Uncharacterized protein n=1 Tax=Pinctada imbricata TaxID=66713 RepID=A0AA89BV45_PINIB|nr:hypothetical protein FSP39_024720 [Pinctada imbricata]
MDVQSASLALLLSLFLLYCSLCEGGWTSDGGYIGAYPGGCATTSECPPYEMCMHIVEETICPYDHQNLCRCTLGCEFKNLVLRFEQWRPVEGHGMCLCESPLKNKVK